MPDEFQPEGQPEAAHRQGSPRHWPGSVRNDVATAARGVPETETAELGVTRVTVVVQGEQQQQQPASLQKAAYHLLDGVSQSKTKPVAAQHVRACRICRRSAAQAAADMNQSIGHFVRRRVVTTALSNLSQYQITGSFQ